MTKPKDGVMVVQMMTNRQAALIAAAARGSMTDHDSVLPIAERWADWLDSQERTPIWDGVEQ